MHVTRETALIGTTELRKEMPNFAQLKIKTVVVMKRGKPVAVLEDFEQFEEKERLLDEFEDIVLGFLAKERDEKSKKNEYISEGVLAKSLGVRL